MNIDLRGQTALITGASGQLGRVMARTLAQCGADIVIHYIQNEEKAIELQAEIIDLGRRAITVQADVTKADEVTAMKERALGLTGAVDIVVANAVVQYKWTSAKLPFPICLRERQTWDGWVVSSTGKGSRRTSGDF